MHSVTGTKVSESRKWGSSASTLASLLAGVAALALGFGSGCDSKIRCSSNDQCGTGYACQQNQCISIVSGRTLGVEILPPSDSLSARTERPNVVFVGTPVPLTLDATGIVSGTVTPATPPTIYSADAHVQVTIPSRLPGRSPQQIDAEMAMNQFMFGVGSSRLDTVTATFLFTPGATSSQSQPPIPLSAQLASSLNFTFPGSDQMIIIHGQLVDDQHTPLAGYLARALYNGPQGQQQVSNTLPTLADGTFALLIPPGSVPAMNDPITVTLTPPARTLVPATTTETAVTVVDLPQFVSAPISLKALAAQTTRAVYVLPAFIPATDQPSFPVTVVAEGRPQSGVSVRFTMNVPLATGGSASYQASGTSDSTGLVNIQLVPGTPIQPVSYQVMVQGRDATFAYASQCIPALEVDLDAAGNLPPPLTVTLQRKVQLSGTVSDSVSAPAVNAQVVATQNSGVTDCGVNAIAPPVASSKTGAGGEYTLSLDPGTYRIEVDPPPSGMVSYPRMVQDGAEAVTVSGGALVHNIPLPAGSVAMGTIYAPDGTPVPMASVEIFEVFCREANCGAVQPPVSLAQVTTDALGNFQTVLPQVP